MSVPTIAVDFDGTLVMHEYPRIGAEVPDAIYWCQRWVEAGARLILFTMRDGHHREDAVAWCKERGIEFWGVNENPEQHEWTRSPKVYAHVYVDDASACAPLIQPPIPREFPLHDNVLPRPHLDWSKVGPEVLAAIEESV
jgi:hypothetical protein